MTTQYTTDALGYYQILGVPFDADENRIKQFRTGSNREISKAFRSLRYFEGTRQPPVL